MLFQLHPTNFRRIYTSGLRKRDNDWNNIKYAGKIPRIQLRVLQIEKGGGRGQWGGPGPLGAGPCPEAVRNNGTGTLPASGDPGRGLWCQTRTVPSSRKGLWPFLQSPRNLTISLNRKVTLHFQVPSPRLISLFVNTRALENLLICNYLFIWQKFKR